MPAPDLTRRTEVPPTAIAALSPTQVAAVDAPSSLEVCTQWIEADDGAQVGRSRLLLSGLYCAACAGLIEDALQRVEGVRSAEVNGAAQRAVVIWDPARTRVSALIEAVRRTGYGAFPDTGAEAVALAARETRQAIWRLFVAAFCMMQVMMYAAPAYLAEPGDMSTDMVRLLRWASWVLSVPVVLFAAAPFFKGAWRAVRERRIGMDVPVALGIVVTFVASSVAAFDPVPGAGSDVYFDSLTMFVTFLLGARLLESRGRARAAQSLDAVMRRLPDAVERIGEDGRATLVTAAELVVGDQVRVHAGQAFAADGLVLDGRTQVDEAMLTGESLPVDRGPGDEVAAGCLNLGSPVLMRVTRLGAQTRYHRIVELVERALTQRPSFLVSADQIAGPFLWAVLVLAGGAYAAWSFIDPTRAVWVAVSVLIVTCPCALSLGAPVAWLAAAGELARRGVLVQRLDALEALTRVRHLVFDKTGTLTEDRLRLAQVTRLDGAPATSTTEHLRALAVSLAERSRHPLSQALARTALVPSVEAVAPSPWTDVVEQPGLGLQASIGTAGSGMPDGVSAWRLGSAAWCGVADPASELVADEGASTDRPAVWLAQEVAGQWRPQLRFEFDEQLRADAQSGVAALSAAGLQLHLLSGDQPASVERMARQLGIAHHHAHCSPKDKLAAVERLQQAGERVAMVGDGINDAPVLARADVSIAMGSAAALAQARADVIMLSDRISDLALLHHTALRTMRIVRQNLRWAFAYNLACVPLALLGWLPPWLAGIGMAASSLVVVLNALRLARNTSGTQSIGVAVDANTTGLAT